MEKEQVDVDKSKQNTTNRLMCLGAIASHFVKHDDRSC